MTIIDQNRIPVVQAVDRTDGITLMPIKASPVLHSLFIDNGNGSSPTGTVDDPRDGNRKIAFMGISADDGITPIPIYANPVTGALLVTTL